MTEVRLAGMVRAVGKPHGQRRRPEGDAEIDDVAVVVDRRAADRGVGVTETAELVRHLAVARRRRVVLEGVGVHGVEADAALERVRTQPTRVGGIIPGYVQADRARGARQGVERGDVVDLLLRRARLTAEGEARESRPADSQRPRRSGNGKARDLGDDGVSIDAVAGDDVAGVRQIGFIPRSSRFVFLGDPGTVDHVKLLRSAYSTSLRDTSQRAYRGLRRLSG